MAYDLAAIRKAKQTYKPATNTAMGGVMMPIQAISAATRTTPSKATPVATSAAQQMVTNTAPRTEQTLNNLQSTINTGFNYNRNTDDALQAAIKNAQQTVQDTQKNTYAGLRANGQGKSSYSETVAQQIGLKGAAEIENNLVPEYVRQAYGRYQDGISNQSNLYGLQYQQDVTTPMNEAQLTGNYMPPAAQNAINGILALKQQAESKGITAEERAGLSKQADTLRNQLKALGIDPTKYGANINAATAGATQQQGLRTIAGQTLDMNQQESQFNQGITNAQLTGVMPNGTKTTAEQQRQLTNLWTAADQTGVIPDQLATMYNLPKGMETLQAKQFAQQLAISQQNADTSNFSAQTSRTSSENSESNANHSKLMDVWQATGKAPAGLESLGVTAGQQYTTAAANTAATKVEEPKRYEDYQSSISKVVDNNPKNPKVGQDYIKNLPDLSNYEKYRAWIASGYEWPSNVEVPTPGE